MRHDKKKKKKKNNDNNTNNNVTVCIMISSISSIFSAPPERARFTRPRRQINVSIYYVVILIVFIYMK